MCCLVSSVATLISFTQPSDTSPLAPEKSSWRFTDRGIRKSRRPSLSQTSSPAALDLRSLADERSLLFDATHFSPFSPKFRRQEQTPRFSGMTRRLMFPPTKVPPQIYPRSTGPSMRNTAFLMLQVCAPTISYRAASRSRVFAGKCRPRCPPPSAFPSTPERPTSSQQPLVSIDGRVDNAALSRSSVRGGGSPEA
ncbi:hypothetical protein DFH06DRAFT_272575 [Mycena polygramma]|nr:hypothetical protein DFH06DRAFT_272575 [Mycena polygramma]